MNISRPFHFLLQGIMLLAIPMITHAQEGVADKIIAVVGKNKVILQSEIETQFMQAKMQDPTLDDSMKCHMLQQLVFQKLMVEQAERDSLLVTDEDIDGTMENRIRHYIRQFGSKEKLEEVVGKTVYQLKEENKDIIREQLMAEKMQSSILSNIKITPAEVQTFYNKLPQDSLPFYPATVEIGQIVVDPPVNPELDAYAKTTLESIRKRIVEDGESFENLVGTESDDPGSRDNGGRYTEVTRTGGWAPEFVAAAFKLQNGEVSPIVKTQFGYHIIQMIQRKGDVADLRHILKRPQRVTSDYKKAMDKLDSIRNILLTGSISFPEAVGKFSTDEGAKSTGGMVLDQQTGATELEIEKLDPAMVLMLDTLKPGSYSGPQIFMNDRGEQSVRIVYLKSRTAPHKANLKDDYSKIQQVALQQKQGKKLEQWVADRLPNYYIKIKAPYAACGVFSGWKLAQK